jgi:hypothetical protein
LEPKDVLNAVRSGWWLIVGGLLAGLAVAGVLTWLATPLYSSSTRLFVSAAGSTDTSAAYQGNLFSQQRVTSYESPAVPLAEKLLDMGADLRFHDPYVTVWNAAEHGEPERLIKGKPDLQQAIREADVVVLLQAHAEYIGGALDGVRVFDTRGVLAGESVERL